MVDKPKGKTTVRLTPYQFSKNHPELGLRPQAVYQHCLKQLAPHTRGKDGKVLIDNDTFMSWLKKRLDDKQQKAERKQPKLKLV